MSKKLNKVIVSIICLMMMVLCFNVNVKASDTEEEAFNKFSELKDNKTYYLLLGEKSTLIDNSLMLDTTTFKTKDKSIATVTKDIFDNPLFFAKKVGSTTGTITATYNEKTIKKNVKIQVKSVLSKSSLDSKTNDVLDISKDSSGRQKVLLANGELWNTNKDTFKLTKKSAGNISKYVFDWVYFKEGKNAYENVTAILRKNKKLTMECAGKTLSVSNVKQLSKYGYVKTNGDYYLMVLKDGKLTVKKKAESVSKLFGHDLLLKGKKLYTIYGNKISNLDIKDVKGDENCGLFLTTDNKAYRYYFQHEEDKYISKFVEKDVKELLSTNNYKTNAGKGKHCDIYEGTVTSDSFYDELYLSSYGNNELKISLNNALYLNGKMIVSNVTNAFQIYDGMYSFYLLTRSDGSIWRLNLRENTKLTKVRSGKNKYKRISKPTSITVKQASKTSAKITWKAVSGATSYSIYRTTSKTGSYKRVGQVKGTSFTNKSLKKGKTYYYKVKANTSKSLYNSDTTNYVKVTIK